LLISAIMAYIVWFFSVVLYFNIALSITAGIFIYFVLSVILKTIGNKDLVEIRQMLKR
jgi:zinc transporter ZupT